MLASDYHLIATALDTFVNEYNGAAPKEEIARAEELAEHFWIKADEAAQRLQRWREKRK